MSDRHLLECKWIRARQLFPNWSNKKRYEWALKSAELVRSGQHLLLRSGWTRDPEVLR
jgi:hypothetical protein